MVSIDEISSSFLNKSKPEGVYLYGLNKYSSNLLKLFKVNGVIDDYTEETQWMGYDINKIGEIPKNSIVISCVTNARAQTAIENILSNGITRFIDYFKLTNYFPHLIQGHESMLGFDDIFNINKASINYVKNKLEDDESKECFDKIINFKLGNDINYMRGFKYRPHEQYFENFLSLSDDVSFVDCGSYDGFTSIEFAKFTNNKYKNIHVFEPDFENYLKCSDNLKKYRNVILNSTGVSNSKGILRFSSLCDSTSKVDENGVTQINVIDLDSYFSEFSTKLSDPLFIKMDLEGFEMVALAGAKNIIKNNNTTLAVAVYHKISDIFEIPEYILSLNSNYRLYLRHYTEAWTETVMYFVPK